MTEEQIKYLRTAIDVGLLAWWNDGHVYKQIAFVGGKKGEELDVGYLQGMGGDYIALENVEINEIIVTSGNIANWRLSH